MSNKSIFIILSAIFVFAFTPVYASQFDINDGYKFYKRWTEADCFSDGEIAQQFASCGKSLTPQELRTHISYFGLGTDDPMKSREIYCNLPNDQRKKAYNSIISGASQEKQDNCENPDKQQHCQTLKELHNCVFHFLQSVWPSEDDVTLPM